MAPIPPVLPDLETLLSEQPSSVRVSVDVPDDELRQKAMRAALSNAEWNPLYPHLERIEFMARIGLEPTHIAARLGFSASAFRAALDRYPENVAAMERGRAGGVEDMAAAAFHQALIGRDASLMRMYLERKGGFAAAKDKGPAKDDDALMAQAAPVDVGRIGDALKKHTRLLNETRQDEAERAVQGGQGGSGGSGAG